MFNLSTIKTVAVKTYGAAKLVGKRYAPEILTGVGIVGVVVGAVLACKSTLKIQDVLDEAKTNIDNIHESTEQCSDVYSEDDRKKDLVIVYTKTAVAVVKLYALPVGIGILSIGCIMGGHHILRKENAAITAAYIGLAESFKKYRSRVAEDQGEEKDNEYMYGTKITKVVSEDENGNPVEKDVLTYTGHISSNARFFGPGNPNWKPGTDHNEAFLTFQKRYMTQKLHAQEHVFLNEVYDALGLERSKAGAILGWSIALGDTEIDFGLHKRLLQNMNFLEGKDDYALLDFNVGGPILDLFPDTPNIPDPSRQGV